MDGIYISPRNDNPEISWYPIDHEELPFRDLPADAAVCRGTKKGEAIFKVKGGDEMSLDFRRGCTSEMDASKVTYMEKGQSAALPDVKLGGRHGGGMCEISMAFVDEPKWSDFVVIKRWLGTCPDSTISWSCCGMLILREV